MVVARFGAHLDSRPPREADGHRIRGACPRRREVNELVLLEDFHILFSTPADEVGRGYWTSANSPCRILLQFEPPATIAKMPPPPRLISGPQPGAEALEKASGGSRDPPEPTYIECHKYSSLNRATRRTGRSQAAAIRCSRAPQRPTTNITSPCIASRSLSRIRGRPFDPQI